MRSLTWNQVRAFRLARSHLAKPVARGRLLDVVRDTGGIQAQVLSAAGLAIGARVEGSTRVDVVDELFGRRRLVKTWTLRGTLHLHPADELQLWLAPQRARPYWHDAEWLARHELTVRRIERLTERIVEALTGRALTRRELATELSEDRLRSGWGELLGPATALGLVCFGPSGADVTFVRVDEWLGPQTPVDPHEASVEICRRYFAAYGPARAQDLARWLGVKPAAARALMKELDLVEVDVEGHRGWLLRGARGPWRIERPLVRLLPQYDAYVYGSRPREGVLVPNDVAAVIKRRGRGRFEGATGLDVVTVDGVVAGLWQRTKGEVTTELLRRLSRSERERLDEEVARVEGF